MAGVALLARSANSAQIVGVMEGGALNDAGRALRGRADLRAAGRPWLQAVRRRLMLDQEGITTAGYSDPWLLWIVAG
jgi:hypothetical protein